MGCCWGSRPSRNHLVAALPPAGGKKRKKKQASLPKDISDSDFATEVERVMAEESVSTKETVPLLSSNQRQCTRCHKPNDNDRQRCLACLKHLRELKNARNAKKRQDQATKNAAPMASMFGSTDPFQLAIAPTRPSVVPIVSPVGPTAETKTPSPQEERIVESFRCDQCGKTTLDKRVHMVHVKKHRPIRVPFQSASCPSCGLIVYDPALMALHIQREHTWTCPLCPTSTPHDHLAMKQTYFREQDAAQTCQRCKQLFVTQEACQDHPKLCHVQPFDQRRKRLRCPFCSAWSLSPMAMQEHLYRVHNTPVNTTELIGRA